MKKLFFFFGMFLILVNANSQNSCSNPDTIVTGTSYTFPLDTNAGSAQAGPNYSCLATQNNPLWLFTEICGNGSMEITITSAGSAVDVDFICWGPITGVGNLGDLCTQVSTGSVNVVDCSYSTTPSEILDIPNGMAGEYYLIMISNFSNLPGNIFVSQTGGTGVSCDSTGTVYQACGMHPLSVCEVTMNDSSNHTKVLWEKLPGLEVDQYYIHRLNAQNNYVIIDSVPESDSSYYVDYSSLPSTQPYRYKVNYRDTCGNLSVLSSYHQTIHLQASPGFNAVNLDWDSYIGLTFPTYYIRRGTDPLNMNIIDSISSAFTSYTDLNPNGSEPCYQVGFINPDPCFITRSLDFPVVSNVFNTNPMSVEEEFLAQVKIYPNPADHFIRIELPITDKSISVFLMDPSGRLVKSITKVQNGNQISIDELSAGIYLYQIAVDGTVSGNGKLIVH